MALIAGICLWALRPHLGSSFWSKLCGQLNVIKKFSLWQGYVGTNTEWKRLAIAWPRLGQQIRKYLNLYFPLIGHWKLDNEIPLRILVVDLILGNIILGILIKS